ncbi:MAG TPA: cell wall hydrolase [Clostridiales bacterium]|nr:cell wall hydrolase [Clostridiales bacterium]
MEENVCDNQRNHVKSIDSVISNDIMLLSHNEYPAIGIKCFKERGLKMIKVNGLFQHLITSYGRKSKKTIAVVYILSFILLAVNTDSYYKITAGAGMVEAKKVITNEYKIETLSFAIDHTKEIGAEMVLLKDNPANIDSDIVIKKVEVVITEELRSEEIQKTGLENTDNNQEEIKVVKKETLKYDKESIEALERIVQAEAGGEDKKGKVLVANVIINRVKSKKYPNTVEKVVFQKVAGKYQFSPILDKRYWSVKVSSETKAAVQQALDGKDYSDGALYFLARKHASKKNLKWFDNNLKWLFQHGGHEFYKNK